MPKSSANCNLQKKKKNYTHTSISIYGYTRMYVSEYFHLATVYSPCVLRKNRVSSNVF